MWRATTLNQTYLLVLVLVLLLAALLMLLLLGPRVRQAEGPNARDAPEHLLARLVEVGRGMGGMDARVLGAEHDAVPVRLRVRGGHLAVGGGAVRRGRGLVVVLLMWFWMCTMVYSKSLR